MLISQSGRKLYVNNDIDCVCIEFNYWGETKTLQVPFAKYRTEELFKFGTSGLNIVDLINFIDSSPIINNIFLDTTSDMPIITDADLQSRLEYYRSDKSGRENTDIWMQYIDYEDREDIVGLPAVQACRNTSTKGIATAGYFDCPNVYELAIAWIESDNIDILDPTAEEYPNRKLGKTNPEGRFYNWYIWTSTEYSATGVRLVNANGYVTYTTKVNAFYVLPCKVIKKEDNIQKGESVISYNLKFKRGDNVTHNVEKWIGTVVSCCITSDGMPMFGCAVPLKNGTYENETSIIIVDQDFLELTNAGNDLVDTDFYKEFNTSTKFNIGDRVKNVAEPLNSGVIIAILIYTNQCIYYRVSTNRVNTDGKVVLVNVPEKILVKDGDSVFEHDNDSSKGGPSFIFKRDDI